MQTIEAHFEIVTPMFIGGGTPDEVDLRPPSIKGALRFWWRALHWGECLVDTNKLNENLSPDKLNSEALKLLHEKEVELFGAAAKEKTERGQSLFFIKLKSLEKITLQDTWPRNNKDDDAAYLGYGLDKTNDNPHRKAIQPTKFSISLVLKKNITETQKAQLIQTLKLWGLLGGLGSRARRGFGSVNLIQLGDEKLAFTTLEDYQHAVKSLLNAITLAPQMPIFTALNDGMQIAIAGKKHKKYDDLMNELGEEYKTARKSVNGLDRAVFGLPLEGLRGLRDIENRRSSPLLLHIQKISSNYIGVFSFIPAEFHFAYPEGRERDFYSTLDKYMKTMTRIYP